MATLDLLFGGYDGFKEKNAGKRVERGCRQVFTKSEAVLGVLALLWASVISLPTAHAAFPDAVSVSTTATFVDPEVPSSVNNTFSVTFLETNPTEEGSFTFQDCTISGEPADGAVNVGNCRWTDFVDNGFNLRLFTFNYQGEEDVGTDAIWGEFCLLNEFGVGNWVRFFTGDGTAEGVVGSASGSLTYTEITIQAGLYAGVTAQGARCTTPSNPGGSCHARFFVASTLDMLIQSSLVDEVFLTKSCSNGAAFAFMSFCQSGATSIVTLIQKCSGTVPITNGHWENHTTGSSGTFDIVADCEGNTCSGTLSSTNTNPPCATDTLTWTATATGQIAAASSSGTSGVLPEVMEVDEGIEGSKEVEATEDGDVFITVLDVFE